MPAWRRIADELAIRIGRGEPGVGESLPPAAEMAEQYGVHRHTVRQAYRHLQDVGLVTVERGRGTLVTGQRYPYRIGRRVSFRENFGLSGLTVSSDVIRAYVTPGPREICDLLRTAADAPLWRIRTLNRAGGHIISTALHHVAADRFADFGTVLDGRKGSISAALRHYGITSYLRLATRISARNATDAEARLLDIKPGDAMLRTLGVDGVSPDAPVHVVESLFVADRVEFLVEPEDAPASDRALADDGEAQA